MSNTKVKIRGQYQEPQATDMREIAAEINRLGPVVIVKVVTAGTEVAVRHGCDKAPSSAFHVAAPYATYGLPSPEATPAIMGVGVIYPTTTAWTSLNAYLTATEIGYYAVQFRR